MRSMLELMCSSVEHQCLDFEHVCSDYENIEHICSKCVLDPNTDVRVALIQIEGWNHIRVFLMSLFWETFS